MSILQSVFVILQHRVRQQNQGHSPFMLLKTNEERKYVQVFQDLPLAAEDITPGKPTQ